MTPISRESAADLQERISRTAEAATGIPRQHWRAVIGRISRTPYSWEPEYHGDPTSIMIARRIVDIVRDHFDLAPTPTPATIADNEASLIEHDRLYGLAWEHPAWRS